MKVDIFTYNKRIADYLLARFSESNQLEKFGIDTSDEYRSFYFKGLELNKMQINCLSKKLDRYVDKNSKSVNQNILTLVNFGGYSIHNTHSGHIIKLSRSSLEEKIAQECAG